MAVPAADNPFLYRPLQEQDCDSVLQFLPGMLPGQWSREKLLASSWQQRVLAQDAQNRPVCAYAEFYVAADECHLLGIAVAPSSQRQGLGRQLLAAVMKEAVDRGCKTCLLEVRASNQAAIGLYEKAGFTLAGVRKGYYPALQAETGTAVAGRREDARLYSRSLSMSS
jgi:ribosomal-protein-alanine N-acetyltransferase